MQLNLLNFVRAKSGTMKISQVGKWSTKHTAKKSGWNGSNLNEDSQLGNPIRCKWSRMPKIVRGARQQPTSVAVIDEAQRCVSCADVLRASSAKNETRKEKSYTFGKTFDRASKTQRAFEKKKLILRGSRKTPSKSEKQLAGGKICGAVLNGRSGKFGSRGRINCQS